MQLFIIGRSGRGKDTLANYLADKKGMKVLKSYTTREPKFEGEDSHIFISEDEVDNYPNKVASTVLNDTIYFATQEQYDDSDIYIIDPYGTFEDNSDVSYDIMSEEKNCLYKHIQERFVRKA